ncbi:hypothetical protein C2845_PM03G26830 [Panicum miliaceum]|uniref:Uncharacterized protein n=1 Tax=Panicum miliaceum TaxID=4540 RepID=A0A3L6T6I9_PANMI|nr:hypothetical protein C2845_PM03G26830 [Panicum miliaceum]
MSQTGSSNTSGAHHEPTHSGEPSRQTAACSTSQRRKPRTQTKWPNDVVKVEDIDGEGFPTNGNGLKRWRLICGLIAQQRVGINVKFEDVDQPMQQGLFEIMNEYLEFHEGTSEAQMNRVRGATLKSIAKLHRHFKSNLHRGRVRGVSSLKGWKEGYGKDNESLWKKKKRTSMHPDRLKKEIMDEIFGKLRAAGIDIDAALGASIGKSSYASKEVEQPLIAPAGQHSHPSPGGHSISSPNKWLGPSHDEPDTFNQLKGPTACSLVTGSFSTMLIQLA